MSISEPGLGRAFGAFWLLTSAWLLLSILAFDYGRDQAIYAVVARSMLAGGMPYRDAWDFKPPGIFLVFALARGMFGGAQVGIRIIEVLGLVAMMAALVRLSRGAWGQPGVGLVAGGLAVLSHAQYDFWHTAQPESFGGILTILALALLPLEDVLGSRAPAPGTVWPRARWFVAGTLFAFCGLLKPPLGGAAVVVAAAMVLKRWNDGRRGVLKPLVALLLGGCLPLFGVLGWFWWRGALGDLVETLATFAPRYTALAWEGVRFWELLLRGFSEGLRSTALPTILGLLAFVGCWRSVPRNGLAVLLALALVQIAGAVLQGKFFTYHYGALGPVLALLAGLGWFALWRRLARFGGAGAGAFFFVVGTAALWPSANHYYEDSFAQRSAQRVRLLATGLRDTNLADELASAFGVNAAANRAAASWVAAQIPQDRPLLVWGFEPVIYDLANRAAASRYVYNVPQRSGWSMAVAQERMLSDIRRRPPAAIVVERDDRMAWVTGNDQDSEEALAAFPELTQLLASRYHLARTLERFDVYLENPLPSLSPSTP